MAKVTVTSNKGIFINAMKSQIEAALTDCGLDAQNFAMDKFHTYSWSGLERPAENGASFNIIKTFKKCQRQSFMRQNM